TLKTVITEARAVHFPMESIPNNIKEWLEAMAWSRNTRPEFVLLSCLPALNSILGPTTKVIVREGSNNLNVKHPRKAYTESSGLFVIILSEPGSGKSNAFTLAVEDPLLEQENDLLKSLTVQDYTKKGLFESLKSHKGRGLLASSELQNFFDSLMRKQQEGYGERNRLNTLYDGNSLWSMTSSGGRAEDGKEKREELRHNTFCIDGFAQPEPFINAYRPLAKLRDGFADRLLVCSIQPKLLKASELDSYDRKLDDYPIQNFHTIYEQVFEYHKEEEHNYSFDPAAKVLYNEISDEMVDQCNSVWNSNELNDTNSSKEKRNLVRITLSLHILISTLNKFLVEEQEENMVLSKDDIPLQINSSTLQIGKDIVDYFSQQRDILNKVFQTKGSKKSQCGQQSNAENDYEVDDEFFNKIHSYVDQLVKNKADE
uniref:DUF3987 domain-containing protein n=1 Tax=Clytia hemisphaerica TaxID=252671 RepID=A0A7M5X4F5_9CNID